MKRLIAIAMLGGGIFAAPDANAVHYSKLGIITTAKAAGKWEMVKAWIEQAGYTDEWQAAAYFSDEYPLFATITNQVVVSGIATRAEIDAFLAAARDTAPDAMLGGVYERDMETRDGRRRWHGDFVSRFETNTETRIIQRVDVYADGYEWVCPAKKRWYTPEEQAEREARRKSGRTLEERIAALRAQIEALETKKASLTNEVEIAYAVIQIAQKQKTLARLEASQTNVVNVVVSPEVN